MEPVRSQLFFSWFLLLGPEQGTCKDSIVFLRIIFRAWAGKLQGPYCISNDSSSFLRPEQGTYKDPIVFTNIIRARGGNLQGQYCFSKDYFLGLSRETARTLLYFKWFFIFFRARAGKLQGPYCISNDSLFFLGPEQGTCKDPIVFQIILYLFFSLSQMITFFTA